MKNQINRSIYAIIATVILFFGSAAVISNSDRGSDEWEVPERIKQMENPVEADNQSLRIGQSMYRRNCRDCHGSRGKGDGPESADLETTMRDFASDEVQSQTDGELYYKTYEGRDEMPGFNGDLHEVDIWNIVNYIKTLKEE
jgi:mono/diheme cytochrome c family protein